MKYKQICCIDSIYSLFLYFLLFPDAKNTTLFFVSNGIKESIRNKLPHIKYVYTPKSDNKFILFFYHFFIYIVLYLYIKKHRISRKIPIYGHDSLKWTDFFVHSTKNFVLIEDGVANYTHPIIFYNKYRQSSFYRFLVNTFSTFTLPFGLSNNVNKICLTGILDIPDIIRNKVEIINTNLLWKQLSKEQKKNILNIYISDMNDINYLMSTKRSVLLLTQCLSEDGKCTEQEKIGLYRKMLNGYPQHDIIIKTHPRERTNYKIPFPEAYIISSSIPLQLLNLLLSLNIKTAITYNSTSIYCLSDKINRVIFDESLKL